LERITKEREGKEVLVSEWKWRRRRRQASGNRL
jgi:hypothetical protein